MGLQKAPQCNGVSGGLVVVWWWSLSLLVGGREGAKVLQALSPTPTLMTLGNGNGIDLLVYKYPRIQDPLFRLDNA